MHLQAAFERVAALDNTCADAFLGLAVIKFTNANLQQVRRREIACKKGERGRNRGVAANLQQVRGTWREGGGRLEARMGKREVGRGREGSEER